MDNIEARATILKAITDAEESAKQRISAADYVLEISPLTAHDWQRIGLLVTNEGGKIILNPEIYTGNTRIEVVRYKRTTRKATREGLQNGHRKARTTRIGA